MQTYTLQIDGQVITNLYTPEMMRQQLGVSHKTLTKWQQRLGIVELRLCGVRYYTDYMLRQLLYRKNHPEIFDKRYKKK